MNQLPRHNCLIYGGSPNQLLPAIGTLLTERLIAGYRCLYVNSPTMVDGLHSYLGSTGLNHRRHTEQGALILSSNRDYLVDGRFDGDSMIDMLRGAALQAQKDGFSGFWASGDMTWELGSKKNLEKLLEYECKLEELFHEIPTLNGICQYHMGTLPSACIEDALYTHRGLYVNETLSKVNPHYIEPRSISTARPEPSDSRLNEMLEQIGGFFALPEKARA